ncbi:hypothetical protein [Pseudoalteromonas pernae]|uniref:hypothetical protein n=1 Tax=Pseudoalteromonas pernae TaxID=3118054 RepID=UPI0032423FFB
MKLFKKALVASAIVGAFSAHAVNVSSDKIQLSKEGAALGLSAELGTVATNDLVLDFVVEADTPASSIITLTFDESVDMANLGTLDSVSVTQDVTNGTGTVDLAANGTIEFDYGTGSFTFDDVTLDQNESNQYYISFEVNLGNPLVANSAFRVTVSGQDANTGIEIGGAAEVCYNSVYNNNAIEQGCATISEEVSQLAFEITKEWDGVIERVDQIVFVDDFDNSDNTNDTLMFTIMNDQTITGAYDFEGAGSADLVFEANWGEADVAEFTETYTGSSGLTLDNTNGLLTLAGTNANTGSTAAEGDIVFLSDANTMIPVTGSIDATLTFTGTPVVGDDIDFVLEDYAGMWTLDATVLNVPYIPVNNATVQTAIHFVNESSATTGNIRATAVSLDTNERFASVDLGDIGENTMKKVSHAALATAFGITDATKLSVTFNIDGDAEDINAFVYSQNDKGRTTVAHSQHKVDGK